MFVIFITGGSASGKSTFAEILNDVFPNSFLLSQDNFIRDVSHLTRDEVETYDFDHPNAIDDESLFQCIQELVNGSETFIPQYNFHDGSVSARHTRVERPEILIVEGIFSMHFEQVRAFSQMNVFIHASDEVRLERRINRDIATRGCTRDKIISRYDTFVRPAYNSFIHPQMSFCQHVFTGTDFTQYCETIIETISVEEVAL